MVNKQNPMTVHPIPNADVTYIKPTITRANIEVGDFSYYSGENFEGQVLHHYEFYGDKLIIGKFCQIAAGVRLIMNGANHQMNAASTFPFYIFPGWEQAPPKMEDLQSRGDTIIGNDVWIGQDATILPGVKIGNGAIIALGSVVGSDVAPYMIVAGNPAKPIRKRFDDELIALLERFAWWDRPVEKIQSLIPLLANSNLAELRTELKARLAKEKP